MARKLLVMAAVDYVAKLVIMSGIALEVEKENGGIKMKMMVMTMTCNAIIVGKVVTSKRIVQF
jgi:hypothetical protein